MANINLKSYLDAQVAENGLSLELAALLCGLGETGKKISHEVSRGALAGVLGLAGTENVQGEDQKKLDVISNEIMVEGCFATGAVTAVASEEMDHCLPAAAGAKTGPLLVCFDPLDGSSNVDIDATIGTIFSVLPAPAGKTSEQIVDEDFLQPGTNQLAAGYILYGPQTLMAFTVGRGTVMFTLDRDSNDFYLTVPTAVIPEATQEFAINCSNMRHWEAPVKDYMSELFAGKTGVRGKDFNMRWVACMATEVHRLLCRGGIFMYPKDNRNPDRPGKLRLMYEANPMSWLIEQAGGHATNGYARILEIRPEKLHQRVAVFLGAAEEVDRVTSYHQKR